MLILLRLLTAAAVAALLVLAAVILLPPRPTPPQEALAADWQPAQGEGEYVMRLADCAACHTAEGGQPFAGGRPIASPLGTIWSSNITPDPDHGIGQYTLDEFRAALVDGIRQDGAHLYPAMPYENYRKMSEEDIRALYAYFMQEVVPVAQTPPATDLAFPFDQRWGIRLWNWVALGEPGFHPHMGDALLDRGAYLAEGPGHCGACHSPRNLVMAQDGLKAGDEGFLTGGEIDGWSVPPLAGPESAVAGWSMDDLRLFFASGRNDHVGVLGEMRLVIDESTQYWTEGDIDALSAYLFELNKGVSPRHPDPTAVDRTAEMLTAATDLSPGARLYLDNCNACHFVRGQGADQVFPELAGSSLVNGPKPTGIIDVILRGAALPSTEARPYRLRMPAFGDRLSDAEVAELASFVRSAWGNTAGPVTEAEVAAHRQALEETPPGGH